MLYIFTYPIIPEVPNEGMNEVNFFPDTRDLALHHDVHGLCYGLTLNGHVGGIDQILDRDSGVLSYGLCFVRHVKSGPWAGTVEASLYLRCTVIRSSCIMSYLYRSLHWPSSLFNVSIIDGERERSMRPPKIGYDKRGAGVLLTHSCFADIV